MNNYIIFITIFIFGLIALLGGLYNYRKFKKVNEIISFGLNQHETEVFFKKDKYTITTLGGSNIQKLPISIMPIVGNSKIDIYENMLKYKFLKDGKFGVDYCNFTVSIDGLYIIYINQGKISIEQSAPVMLSPLVEKTHPDHLQLVVKEYSSPIRYIGSLILSILGVAIMMLSIVFILYIKKIILPTN